MVRSGGPSRVVHRAAFFIAAVAVTASCGGRSGLFAIDSDGGDGGTTSGFGGSVSAGTAGLPSGGSGGSVGAAGGFTSGGAGGSVTGGTGAGTSGNGGAGGSAGVPPIEGPCGDAQLSLGEECDDGNRVSGDGCTSVCRVEPGATCADSGQSCTFSICGNGVVDVGEECDAATSNGLFYGDRGGCSEFCLHEPDCRFGICARRCGDGNVDPGEACDDGNRFGGDGCGIGCGIEPGYTCEQHTLSLAEPCSDEGALCQQVGIIYRDFDPWEDGVAGGHPDFYLLGTERDRRLLACVPDASGRSVGMNGDCYASDSTSLCNGFVDIELGLNGRPSIDGPVSCECRFTDWTDSGILGGHPWVQTCNDSDGAPHAWLDDTVTLVAGTDTFAEWFSATDRSTEMRSSLELRADVSGFRFSSGRTVEEDIHAIFMGQSSVLSSGFFPVESLSGRRVCNLFPYFLRGLSGDCNAGPGKLIPHEWDPRGSDTPGVEGTGGIVTPVRGVERNFYFTSEAHVLYRYTGSGTISFAGDDDAWVYLNGHLVLDLGGTHSRLRGTVTLNEGRASWLIEAQDPTTLAFETVLESFSSFDIEIEPGNIYDLAIFHANRSPRDSNYELTIDRNERVISTCFPACGDGVATIGEECDLGESNTESGYGGCTLDCHLGPYCGDGIVNSEFGEQCDPLSPGSACDMLCRLPVK